jgi:DUF1680 family protein
VKLEDVALDAAHRQFTAQNDKVAGVNVMTLSGAALEIPHERKGTELLYQEMSGGSPKPIQIKLVPYFAWGNRGNSDMSVWLPVR